MPFYAVAQGRTTGIFQDWHYALSLVHGFKGAKWQRFPDEESAENYLDKNVGILQAYTSGFTTPQSTNPWEICSGYGVYFPESRDFEEVRHNGRLAGSLQDTVRAEFYAIINAIEQSPGADDYRLHIFSTNRFCVQAINEFQWKWRKNGWISNAGNDIANQDLIRLLENKMQACVYRPYVYYAYPCEDEEDINEARELAEEGIHQPYYYCERFTPPTSESSYTSSFDSDM